MIFLLGLLVGLLLGILLMVWLNKRDRKNLLEVWIPMNIKATASYPLGPLRFTDGEGNTVPRPAGSTIEWSTETTVGTDVGFLSPHRDHVDDDLYQEIEGGDFGSEGVVKVTVTIPREGQDPRVITRQSTILTVIAGDLDAFDIPIGDEFPEA